MSADFFIKMAVGYRGAKALMVAVRHGLFDVIHARPSTAAEVATALRLDPVATGQLLGALGALGTVEVHAGRFRTTELAAAYLVRGGPDYIGHALHFADMLWDSWSHLGDTLQSGRPHKLLPELLAAEDQAFTQQYIRGMQGLAHKPARELAQMLEREPPRSLLDVGCGPGAYSIALLEAYPELRATLFDLPPTLRVARDVIGDHPAAPRLRYRDGDYLAGPYGSEYDLVLMSHVTHDESPANVARMFGLAFEALVPGGRIVVHDWVVDESGCAPQFPALFSLHVMLYTDGGRVYRLSEYTQMLHDAGFVDVTSAAICAGSPNPTTAITARRP